MNAYSQMPNAIS